MFQKVLALQVSLHPHTRRVLTAILYTSVLSWILFTLSWGVNWHQEQNAHQLTVRILDLDGGIVGAAIRNAITEDIQNNPGFHLGWQVVSDAGREEESVVDSVLSQE